MNSLPFLLKKSGSRQDNIVQKKTLFRHLLATSNLRWISIKQKCSYTNTKQKSRHNLWKTNDTDREEQDTWTAAPLFQELLLHNHSYNFKASHNGNWKCMEFYYWDFQQLRLISYIVNARAVSCKCIIAWAEPTW